MKDKVGQDIVPGSIIVYAISKGDSPALRIGKVIDTRTWHDSSNREQNRITVHGVEDPYSWTGDKPTLLSKRSTLQYPDRTTVVSINLIHEDLRKLLERIDVP